MMLSPGAAKVSVPNKVAGMALWICGVPGRAAVAKVKMSKATAPGISRRGT